MRKLYRAILSFFKATINPRIRFAFFRAGLSVNPDAMRRPQIINPVVVLERIANPEAGFDPCFICPAKEIRQKAGRSVQPTRTRISDPTGFAITLVAHADLVARKCPLGSHAPDQEEESTMENDNA
jgi:hypothetical protein